MKNGTKDRVLISLFRFKFFMTVVLLLLTMLLVACVYNAGRDTIDRSTVKNFDLKSYMGRWYEIARFDHRFERGMTDVTATYTLQNKKYGGRAYMLLCDDTERDYGDPEAAAEFKNKCFANGFYTISEKDEFTLLYPEGVQMEQENEEEVKDAA